MSLASQHMKKLWYNLSGKTQVLLFLKPVLWLAKVKEGALLRLGGRLAG